MLPEQAVDTATPIKTAAYRTLIDLLSLEPAAYCILDLEGRYLTANACWLSYYQLDMFPHPQALMGRSFYEHNDAILTQHPTWPQCIEKVLSSGQMITEEDTPYLLGDDPFLSLDWSILPWQNQNTLCGVIIRCKKRSLFDAWKAFSPLTSEIFCIMNTDTAFIEFNGLLPNVFECSPQMLKQQSLTDYIAPEDVNHTKEEIKALCTQQHKSHAFNTRVCTASGQVKWLSWSASLNPKHQLIYATARDITTTHQYAKQLKKKNKLLDSLTELQRSFIEKEDVRDVFDALLKTILQVTDSEYGFIGEILFESDGTPYLKTRAITDISWDPEIKKFYQDNAPQGLEFRNLNSLFGHTIRTKEMVMTNAPYDDPRRCGLPPGHPPLNKYLGLPIFQGDNMIGMVGLANREEGYDQHLIDYIEPFTLTLGTLLRDYRNELRRKQAEQDLEQRNNELERSNKELGHFAYAASHDLQEPLRTLSIYSELVADGVKQNNPVDDYVREILASAGRMRRIIQDILAFSRIGEHVPLKRINLNACLTEALANLESRIQSSNATVEMQPLPHVIGAHHLIAMLFQNLIANGIKYQPAGQTPNIQISFEEQEDKYCICVSDNGIGIEADFFEQIFSPFKRLHTQHHYPGTGIGLAMCEKITALHQGKIWVESEGVKQGSRFYFTLNKT